MKPATYRAAGSPTGPTAALLLNALLWGLSWWPLRALQERGLHPLWATALVCAVASVCIVAWRPPALTALRGDRGLWLLGLAAGLTNACFNWGVTEGDVVRVVLLFYLMPVWTTLLAWPLLGEVPRPAALLRMVLSLTGVATVLHQPGAGWPVPESLPDWLGLAGGFFFSINNILLLRLRDRPDVARTLAMFVGGGLTATVIAGIAAFTGMVAAPSGWSAASLLLIGLLAAGFLVGNTALQYGAARLSAHSTSLVMLSEVAFASGSSIMLGASQPSLQVALGGAMILAAAAWSALAPARTAVTASSTA